MNKYRPMEIANYIIKRCTETNYFVNQLRMQKILYFVFGVFYKERNEKLFNEKFKAFAYGPILKSVYQEYAIFGTDKLTPLSSYDDYDVTEYGIKPVKISIKDFEPDEEDKPLIDYVIDKTKMASDKELGRVIKEMNAWKITKFLEREDIEPELIKSSF